jgi:predicted acyltransferase
MAGSGSELSTGAVAAVAGGEEAKLIPGARLLSLDVFRGLTIASMMLVNNAGNWTHVYAPLRHAEWHGWTFTDTVFPFFLWIAGVAMTFSFSKRVDAGVNRRYLTFHALRRGSVIFALGIFLNGFPYFELATLRIPGVLQRIGICYFLAAVVFLYASVRLQAAITAVLLFVYWALMTLVPVPGYGAGVLEKMGNLAQYLDSLFLSGHMWSATKVWDPEGIVSTIPAISTTLFGVLTGHLLRSALTATEKTVWMLFSGNLLLFAGLVWDKLLPINKNLWTSSYAVFMAGMALVVFGVCYWIIDVHGHRGWCRPLAIYGMNAIAVYVLAGLISRLIGIWGWRQPVYEILQPFASPINASLVYALGYVMLLYGVAWLLHRNRWFLRV